MQVRRLDIRHFRGFEAVTIRPGGHVLLAGEPRAGRSDVIEALSRVLDPDATRAQLTDDLDFFGRDTASRAEIEVVLGDLGPEWEQVFFDEIEFWDPLQESILSSAETGDSEPENHERVVRLCYRAEWRQSEQVGEHWVDFPKFSDPESGNIRRVSLADLTALPFQRVDISGRPLRLTTRAPFRSILSLSQGDDFAQSLELLIQELRAGSGNLAESKQLQTALAAVFEDIAWPLGIGDIPPNDFIRFVPDGGTLPALLRAFSPTINLGDKGGYLPLHRQGSTSEALISTGEALAATHQGSEIIIVDDFGEGMDAASSRFAAQALRSTAKQAWVSTRRGPVAEPFSASEIFRLTRTAGGKRSVFRGQEPSTKHERLAARHRNLQLLPALSAKALIIFEGPHDLAAYDALSARLYEEEGALVPGAHGIHLVHAAAADSAGGSSATARLARTAKSLGFRVVTVIDHDKDTDQVKVEVRENVESAHAVVRLPFRFAVERALVSGLDTAVLREALKDLRSAFGLSFDLQNINDSNLEGLAINTLKSAGGLHAEFLEALPQGCVPVVARRVLEKSLECALSQHDGLIEL